MSQQSPIRWRRALAVSLVAHGLFLMAWNTVPWRGLRLYPAPPPSATRSGDPFMLHDEEPGGSFTLASRPGTMTPRAKFVSPFEIDSPVVPVSYPPPATLPIQPKDAKPLDPKPAIPGEPGKLPPLDAIPLSPHETSPETQRVGAAAPSGVAPSRFFPVDDKGKRIVYVIDRSMSMGEHGAREAALLELLKSLHHLPSTSRFQILVYNTDLSLVPTGQNAWLEPTRGQIDAIAQYVVNLRAEGRTDHGPALKHALSLQPDVVYFLTDADDLNAEHLRLAEAWNRAKTVVHTIELTTRHRDRPDMPMQLLARTTGGTYRAIDLAAYWKEARQ